MPTHVASDCPTVLLHERDTPCPCRPNAGEARPSEVAEQADASGGAGETNGERSWGRSCPRQRAGAKAGDGLAVLEAMKTDNLILCHRDGIVKELLVKGGDTMQIGTPIDVIGPPSA